MKLFSKKNHVDLTNQELRLIRTMQLLGDSTRFKIFKLIMDKKELCVTEIADELRISVPAVSQHFRIFELVGLVDKERMGKKICYMLKGDDVFVSHLSKFIRKQ